MFCYYRTLVAGCSINYKSNQILLVYHNAQPRCLMTKGILRYNSIFVRQYSHEFCNVKQMKEGCPCVNVFNVGAE